MSRAMTEQVGSVGLEQGPISQSRIALRENQCQRTMDAMATLVPTVNIEGRYPNS
jgi:hypothetical protein